MIMKVYSRLVYWIAGALITIFLLFTAWNSGHHTTVVKKVGSMWPADFSKTGYKLRREKATFITLARNEDLEDLLETIRSVEDRFNRKYHYDWVFVNEEAFTEEFKEVASSLISGTAKFGTIPKEHWSYPEWIDQNKAADARQRMKEEGVFYGGKESYRHMCRFESGFFFHHPLMQDYRYYWRVEPSTKLFCDIDYDVFKFMRKNDKKYGWTISITEFRNTIPTLWNKTTEFIEQHPDYIHPNALQGFVRDRDDPNEYNLCHYWTNFEIGDLEFWRSKEYQEYFNFLDQAGGFFYERWGDAPVHSIGVSLFMDQDKIHFFDDIGYHHPPFTHCPAFQREKGLKCNCLSRKSFDWHESSCLRIYNNAKGIPRPADYHDGK